jgi:hypothetical protein
LSRLDGITEALRGLSAALSSTNTNQPPTMSDAIYNHTAGRLHTCLNADGVCMFTGKTVEQMQQESAEQLEVMPFIQALELSSAADRARYCTGPKRITQERYEEMLNVLPPENWQRGVGYSCFRLSERLCGAIASFFVRIGDSYYQINENENTDPGVLFRACMDHDAPPESAAAICRRAGC